MTVLQKDPHLASRIESKHIWTPGAKLAHSLSSTIVGIPGVPSLREIKFELTLNKRYSNLSRGGGETLLSLYLLKVVLRIFSNLNEQLNCF